MGRLGEPRKQVGGCVLQGSRALAKATHWRGSGFEVVMNSPITASVTSLPQQSVQDAVCGTWPLASGWPEEPEGRLDPGHLAPSAMTSWVGSGDFTPRELPGEICLLLARTGLQRVKTVAGDLALSCQSGEYHSFIW